VVFSTNKTDRDEITEILLEVALNKLPYDHNGHNNSSGVDQ
jgi:hypothetical protein